MRRKEGEGGREGMGEEGMEEPFVQQSGYLGAYRVISPIFGRLDDFGQSWPKSSPQPGPALYDKTRNSRSDHRNLRRGLRYGDRHAAMLRRGPPRPLGRGLVADSPESAPPRCRIGAPATTVP